MKNIKILEDINGKDWRYNSSKMKIEHKSYHAKIDNKKLFEKL